MNLQIGNTLSQGNQEHEANYGGVRRCKHDFPNHATTALKGKGMIGD